MNWGTGLVVGLLAFMAFIVGSVFYMVGRDTDSLVEHDYYDKGLHYEEVYTWKANLQHDRAKPEVRIKGDSLYIHFTAKDNRGVLVWKRPSDGRMDREQHFSISGEEVRFPLTDFTAGHWQIQLTWTGAGTEYQSEHNLFLP